jgi:hypothetical protein
VVPPAKFYWKFSLLGWATVTLLAWILAGARFFPLLYRGQAHAAVVGQLLLGAAAAATEVGLLLGVTGGLVVAELRSVLRGGRPACGEPDSRRARGRMGLGLALGWLVLAGALGLGSAHQLSKTIRVVRSVIEQARSCCLTSPSHRSAVPLLGVEWLCEPGKPVRLSGSRGPAETRVLYSVETLDVGDDLSSLVATGLSAERGRTTSFPAVRLKAATVRVHGIAGWARPRRLSETARAGLVAVCCAGLGLGVVVSGARGRVRHMLFALLPSVAVLLAIWWIDATPKLSSLVYGFVPLLALVPCVGMWLLCRRRRGVGP